MAAKNSDSFSWIFLPFALVWEWRKRMGFVGPATILAVLALLSYGFHQYTVPRLANWPEYELTADRWEITQKPNWIRRDVARDAIAKSDLTHASLLDPQLAEKTSQAFLLCSWVKEVNRVEKRYPARVRVDLTYRRPVAMVEVIDQEAEKEGMACFPVDDAGALLPTSDFSQTDLAHYPRIRVADASLQAPAGAVWGDARVEQAALVAGAIIEHYKQWGVERIELVPDSGSDRRAKGPFLFRLIAARGLIIDFGHAPGMESSEEATASQKIRWVNDHRTKNGSFDTLDPGYIIDLRDANGLRLRPTIGE